MSPPTQHFPILTHAGVSPRGEPGSGPSSSGVCGPTSPVGRSSPSSSAAPPTPTEEGLGDPLAAAQGPREEGAAPGLACSWLTCLLTPGNGCLREVLYFLVLLQKTLQKPGSFLNGNSEASSKPLLPCVSRNSVSGQPTSDPVGPGGARQGPACVEASPQGLWRDSGRQGPVGTSASSDRSGCCWLLAPGSKCLALASLDRGLVNAHLLECRLRAWQVLQGMRTRLQPVQREACPRTGEGWGVWVHKEEGKVPGPGHEGMVVGTSLPGN